MKLNFKISLFLPLSFAFLTMLAPPTAEAAAKAKPISVQEKAKRLQGGLTIARKYVQEALANRDYAATPRRSSVRGGPTDIRVVLKRFLAEMPENVFATRLIFDGSGLNHEACPASAERYGGRGSRRHLYIYL